MDLAQNLVVSSDFGFERVDTLQVAGPDVFEEPIKKADLGVLDFLPDPSFDFSGVRLEILGNGLDRDW